NINQLLKEGEILTKEIVNEIPTSYNGQSVQRARKENQFDFNELLNNWVNNAQEGKILKDNGKSILSTHLKITKPYLNT
ncbi:MAG: hypothetical protein VW078_06595, partial [Flavobacteriales bacterium]